MFQAFWWRGALVAAVAIAAAAVATARLVSGSAPTERRFSGAAPVSARALLGGARAGPVPARATQQLAGTPAPTGRPATVRIDVRARGRAVPADFLGLSFETLDVPRLDAEAAHGNEVVQLLGSLGDGTLRFGGVSADNFVAWSQGGRRPGWAKGVIRPSDLARLASVARASGWGVLLTVNLGHYAPATAAREAATAHALLGPKLIGIEIGNEPDRFPRKHLRGPSWNFAAYRRQLKAYRAAIARSAPGVPIAGPDPSSGERVLPWLRAAAALRPQLLTDHYYPLTKCGSTPTVSDLLGAEVRRKESSMLGQLAAIQRASRIPLRLDETNNVSCKGQPGVSDTFAAALWAADYIARAMAAGVRGVNLHDLIRLPRSYTPLVAAGHRLHAKPEWYALLLLRQLPGSRPLGASVRGAPELAAHAFLGSDGAVRLVLVNFEPAGARPLRVSIPGFARGTILRLSASSTYATSHVQLGARQVAASGRWSARLPLPAVYDARGKAQLALPSNSAALVTLER